MLKTFENIGIAIEFVLGLMGTVATLCSLWLLKRSQVIPSSAKIILVAIAISNLIISAAEAGKSIRNFAEILAQNNSKINDIACLISESIFFAIPAGFIPFLFLLLVYERKNTLSAHKIYRNDANYRPGCLSPLPMQIFL